jgi:TRAP-type C4-dicarboxylate transport system permease small subunit
MSAVYILLANRILRLLEWTLGGVVFVALMTMMLITVVDVVGRYFFNSPVKSAFEITEIALGVSVFAALPLTTIHQEHVTVGLFDSLFTGFGWIVQQLFIGLVSVIALSLFTWRLWIQARQLTEYGDRTLFLSIPLGPMAWFMTIVCALATAAAALVVCYQLAGRAGGHGSRPQ